MREANFRRVQEHSGKRRSSSRTRFPDPPRRGVRPEIRRPVARRPADQLGARELLVPVDPQEQVLLVVAEKDVEEGAVPLDEGVLEEEGLLLRGGDDAPDLPDPRDEVRDRRPPVPARNRVVPDAGPQILRLPHVQDLPAGVAHDVDAGGARERLPVGRRAPSLSGYDSSAFSRARRRSRSSAARSKSSFFAARSISFRSFRRSFASSSREEKSGSSVGGGDVVRLAHLPDRLRDHLPDRLGGDPVLPVVRHLPLPPAARLRHRLPHRPGLPVRVEDDPSGHVARGAAERLHERPGGAEESFLVGVEDRHQGDLGEVEPLPEQVDPDEHIELPEPKVPQDIDPLHGVDVGVEVAHAHPLPLVMLRQVLGHPLREGRDQDPLPRRRRSSGSPREDRPPASARGGPRSRGRRAPWGG